MKIIAIVALRKGGADALAAYVKAVGPLVERAGGRLVSRFEVKEAIEGNESAQFITIVDYPDMTAVDQVFNSDEYRGIRATREAAFSRYDIYVVE